MKVPKQISDGIRILVRCHASGDQLVKIAVVAQELGLTKQMALKLSNILRQLGFLDTVRGPNGGVRLTAAAREATVGEVVRSLLTRPELSQEAKEVVDLDGLYDEAFEAFLGVLDRQPLQDLANRPDRGKAASGRAAAEKKPRSVQRRASTLAEPRRRSKPRRQRGHPA
jgi:Rrf2 family transcriptional regulator, nitric oxide-sensitive transcriptional repressor